MDIQKEKQQIEGVREKFCDLMDINLSSTKLEEWSSKDTEGVRKITLSVKPFNFGNQVFPQYYVVEYLDDNILDIKKRGNG